MSGHQVFDLSGKVAVVTGAASGIGRATAQVLAEAGAAVVCADVQPATLEETVAAIEQAGGRARAVPTDVSKRPEVQAMVDAAVDGFGSLDVLCNAAGIIHNSSVLDTEEADLDRVHAVNFKGVLFGCQAAGQVMVQRGSGSIINVASAAIDHPSPGLVTYATSKAAVVKLTHTMAFELGKSGVRVNAVAPGAVPTAMVGRHYTNADGTEDPDRREAVLAGMAAQSPLGRVGTPEDIAYAVLFLAGDGSRFMTGQILRPNGGVAMPG